MIFKYLLLVIIFLILSGCAHETNYPNFSSKSNQYASPSGKILHSEGNIIKYGTPDLEQHAMDCKLSPNGKILAVEGRFYLVLVDTKTNKIIRQINLKNSFLSKKYSGNMYSGIIFSNDGKHIYWTTSLGDILEATLTKNDVKVK
ncbi:MAG TPA: hypothetical protein ENK66_00035, partial [Arcobacter sp.]|nr:hypothetical protein [Arcobacter sp.]